MTRWSVWMLNAVMAGSACAGEEPLPQDSGKSLEIEPPVLIESSGANGSFILKGTRPLTEPDVELARLEKDLTRAKRNADGGDRLYRRGIISKLDAENRALRVIQLEAKLAEVRLAEAKRNAEESQTNGRVADSAGRATPATVAEAEEVAQRAAEQRRHAELEAALRNLQRQQKLLASGSGRKADVLRAEQKLAELQRATD